MKFLSLLLILFLAVSFAQAIDVQKIMNHLEAFQMIADSSGGNRAAGTKGYNSSLAYVVDQLQQNTNYSVTVQYFNFGQVVEVEPPVFEQTSPESIPYLRGIDFSLMTYTGSGDVSGVAQAANNRGCDSSDFSEFRAGNIAIVARGDCDFSNKVDNAVTAGAVGVIIYNYPGEGVVVGTLGSAKPVPVFGTKEQLARTWIDSNPSPTLRMVATMQEQITYTANVIADTTTGRSDSVIVVGSHLDSVEEGPGINDNGSGSATNLELALEIFKSNVSLVNKIRFAWWGAEELGLLGSKYYVSQAVQSGEIKNIALNLNFDMLASPNYFYGIYDGEGASADIRTGCVKIENLFSTYFEFENLPWNLTAFTGRSDYGPFIEKGIPAGGLFTGAEVIKTPDYRRIFGGIANAAFDTCYHQACDDIYNINQESLGENAKAAYFALTQLAKQFSLLNWLQLPESSLATEKNKIPTLKSTQTCPNFTHQ